MFPDARLAPEEAENSALYGRLLFVLASPESGAELLVDALRRIPGVTVPPASTNLFSSGMEALLDTWRATDFEVAGQLNGLEDLVDEQELLAEARILVDTLLAPILEADSGHLIVEYSPGHIRSARAIAAICPDALLLHVVRHGGDVAARLASVDRSLFWPRPAPAHQWPGWVARGAAEQWCDEQRAADEVSDSPNYLLARIERVLDEPVRFLTWLSEGLGVEITGDVFDAVVRALGAGNWKLTNPRVGRAHALVNRLGSDLLDRYEYPPATVSPALSLVARLEVESDNLSARYRDTGLDLAERLRALSMRWAAEAEVER